MGAEQFLGALGSADHRERGRVSADRADCFRNLRPACRILGKRLRALRMAKGLSFARLARLAKVSHNTVTRAERGDRIPLARNLALIAEALGTTIEELTTEDE